ncbi:hypothetical protein LCI18_008028 [Fusarium solani-melongenae]|uniref:Uncharacterized protein n=1 Tax=Fusarium solani subsp. cucurbitae TaxID=2747967 RepID=A0ACD3Z7Q0_FUSSC|nr:hypothetical protein LCI18_008028 [Fusarium solani-melongenae]
MSFQTPVGTCSIHIPGLGKLDGFQYANHVQQYCGIPYAKLSKRWTRSELNTSWENDYHDGTKLGPPRGHPANSQPDGQFKQFIFENVNKGLESIDHFKNVPDMDELSGLVLNVILPRVPGSDKLPVFAWVHGGSLLFGSSNEPIFDGVNLVSHSIAIGRPIVFVSMNYRIGLGGFLASEAIRDELSREGHQGCGNFGFTDQQVAFEWITTYISSFGGDPDRVTAAGESAGGISIGNQLLAANPPRIQRAICMSGLAITLPPWTMDQHENLFRATCRHFDIDPSQPDVLDRLRQIPQRDLANATPAIQRVPGGSGNPCIDGWFYAKDPLEIPEQAPDWLEAFMAGDTYHEGVIFRMNLEGVDYTFVRDTIGKHIGDAEETKKILQEYRIQQGLPKQALTERIEHMAGDVLFKIPNLATSYAWQPQLPQSLFMYHFDHQSRMENGLKGMAYHAYDLLYLFKNQYQKLDDDEKTLADDFASAWIRFTHDEAPWKASKGQWKVWGPNAAQSIKTEQEDEMTRSYTRMKRMLKMGNGETWKKWLLGVDELVNLRMRVGKLD